MRIVLDTNVLVSGIFWHGIPSKILELWINGKFEIIVSDEIYKEYSKTLFRISKGRKDDLVGKWLILLAEHSTFITTQTSVKVSADPDDDKFLECAIAGKAKYIISGDAHLLEIGSISTVEIITPAVFFDKI